MVVRETVRGAVRTILRRAVRVRAVWATTLGLSVLSACRPSPAAARPAQPVVVRMLLVNDVYVTDTLRDGSGGLARVAALRDSLEHASGSPVLFMLAGDVLSPSVLGR